MELSTRSAADKHLLFFEDMTLQDRVEFMGGKRRNKDNGTYRATGKPGECDETWIFLGKGKNKVHLLNLREMEKKGQGELLIRLSISLAAGAAFPLPPCISKGMKGRLCAKLSRSAKSTSILLSPPTPPFSPVYILLPVLPYPFALALSLPRCVLWIHLQIKQIYHSVTEAGKGGRLWNALAVRAGPGSQHSATPPRTFPAAPALALSLFVFMIRAVPLSAPAPPSSPNPVLPVPTKPNT